MDLSIEGNVFGLDESQRPTLEDVAARGEEAHILHGVRDEGGLVTLAIYDCKKPVIAAINGAAVGIGATMTCAMDIRLLSTKAKVGFVFNKIGITPEACSAGLPRVVGLQQPWNGATPLRFWNRILLCKQALRNLLRAG